MNELSDEIPDETDVLIIGGGISGLALALAMSGQGMRITVLEAADFGSGATANSLRIVHGGLRYFQTLNFVRARRSIRARRELMKFAPGLVRPIECRIPLAKWGIRSKVPISAAFVISDLLSRDRNVGLADDDHLPACKVFRPLYLKSALGNSRDVPAAAWWDAIVTQPHRLVVKLLRACIAANVCVVNHVRVTELVLNDDCRIAGVRGQSFGGDAPISLRCKVAIDTTGCGGRPFRERTSKLRPLCEWVGAANFLLDEQTTDSWATGLRVRERDGLNGANADLGKMRDFFFVPTAAGMMAGTTYVCLEPDSGIAEAQKSAFGQLLDEINRARPNQVVTKPKIKHMFWGLLPAKRGAVGSASARLLQKDLVVDGAKEFGLHGYYRVQGVKLTTAFELASSVVPIVRRYCLARGLATHSRETPAGSTTSPEAGKLFASADPTLVNESLAVMSTEEMAALVERCVRSEYSRTLEDLLQRRVGLVPANYPVESVRDALADHMASALRWSESRKKNELTAAARAVAESPLSGMSTGHRLD